MKLWTLSSHNHSNVTTWAVYVSSLCVPLDKFPSHFHANLLCGNYATDDPRGIEFTLLNDYHHLVGESEVTDPLPSFIEELKLHYGSSPSGDDDPQLEALHANRVWSGDNDSLSYIASAYESCTILRNRIGDATLKFIEYSKQGDVSKGSRWIGHALHMIEDSFTNGHTRRDLNNMALTDVCTARRPFPHREESGSELIQVCAHHEGTDESWNLGSTILADTGFIMLTLDLLAYIRRYPTLTLEDARTLATERLQRYFDDSTLYVTIPNAPSYIRPVDPSSEYPLFQVSGYFDRSPLSRETPIFIKNSFYSRQDHVASGGIFGPFNPNGHDVHYLEYNGVTGAYTVNKITLAGDGQLEVQETGSGTLENGWDHFIPYRGYDGLTWMLAYKRSSLVHSSKACLYRIPSSVDRLELIQAPNSTWPSNIDILTSFHTITNFPPMTGGTWILGYTIMSGAVYIARSDAPDLHFSALNPTKFGNLPAGFSEIIPVLGEIIRRPENIEFARWLLLYNATSGNVQLEKVDYDVLSQHAGEGTAATKTEVISKLDYKPTLILPFRAYRVVRGELGRHDYFWMVHYSDMVRIARLDLSTLPSLEELSAELQAVQNEIDRLNTALERARQMLDDLDDQIPETPRERDELAHQKEDLRKRILNLLHEIGEAERKSDEYHRKIQLLQGGIAEGPICEYLREGKLDFPTSQRNAIAFKLENRQFLLVTRNLESYGSPNKPKPPTPMGKEKLVFELCSGTS